MKRTEVKIKSESSNNEMTILLDEAGDIHIGLHGTITIKGKGSKINSDVYESLLDIINTLEHDVPIGGTITIRGKQYTCRESQQGREDCEGCVLENNHKLCCELGARCCGDERADGKDIIFK